MIDTWEIYHTPGSSPGTHKSYVDGPMTGDWSGAGTKVVSYNDYQKAFDAIREAHRQLSRYEDKGAKQVGRAMLTLERVFEEVPK